jgi:hypothetical protein
MKHHRLAGLLFAVAAFAADTPRTTPGGATFTTPEGWAVRTSGPMVVVDAPEQDSHVVIVDVPSAVDARAAVAAAWKAYRPDSKRPLKLSTPSAPRNGWEERLLFEYETSPNERAVVQARPHRAGKAWTVVILDGTEPTFEKRGAQISLIAASLRPKGYERETFAGRKALPLNAERIAQMKEFLQTSMQKLGVPGASLALVDGGKVVFEGGFGVKELGKPEKVDENTLFMAASNTKGMTTLLLAMLADEKKLRWNQPVSCIPRSSSATRTRQSRCWSSIWCARAPGCRGRTWSGSSSSATRRPRPRWRCSGRCSRPASSARCSSTAT